MKRFVLFAFVAIFCLAVGLIFSCGGNTSNNYYISIDDDTTVDDDTVPVDDDTVDDDASPSDDDAADVWTDPSTGLMWQINPPAGEFLWWDGVAYCAGLTLAGFSDWALPDIDALRSLVRGCASTVTGGACGVTDECLNHSTCWNANDCEGCNSVGPGPNGCFWPAALGGSCGSLENNWYWSSSVDANNHGWGIDFHYANINYALISHGNLIRCVRATDDDDDNDDNDNDNNDAVDDDASPL